MPITARAVRIRAPGDESVLDLGELEVRDPGFGEVRVAVAAAGLNRADLLQRQGFYPAPPGSPPDVPGLEYAGTVEAVGEGPSELTVGNRVMGLASGGAMATHLVVPARETLPVPAGLDLPTAAAIPEVFLTAYDALCLQGGLAPGEVALIHAVGSGVGTAAVQLALAVGARPLGTSRTADKLERVEPLGCTDGILVADGRFAEQVKDLTGGRGADVLLDPVGAAYLGENVAALAPQGRMVVIGLLGGRTGELPLGLVLSRRLKLMGSVLRSRAPEEKATLAQTARRRLLPLFEAGRLKPVVDTVRPMAEIREAHAQMASNRTFGKIVLTW